MISRGEILLKEEFFLCWLVALWQEHSAMYSNYDALYNYTRTPAITTMMKAYPAWVKEMPFTPLIKQTWRKASGRTDSILGVKDLDKFTTFNLKWLLHPMDDDFELGPGKKVYLRYWRWNYPEKNALKWELKQAIQDAGHWSTRTDEDKEKIRIIDEKLKALVHPLVARGFCEKA